jgi:hypothetical protein
VGDCAKVTVALMYRIDYVCKARGDCSRCIIPQDKVWLPAECSQTFFIMKKEKLQNITQKKDWQQNHAIIKNAFVLLFQGKNQPPTQAEIAKRCHLSRKCVNEHLQQLEITDVTPSVKAETLEILTGLSKKAKTGDAPAVKLWMQLVHGWKEETRHSGFVGTFNPSECSMIQLEKIANGEDPAIVLQNKS